jgi:hypothetical protein
MTDSLHYEGIAWNPATESQNRIHGDDVAKQYGFRGGLVPGVTVYACMVEPAIRRFGINWLRSGGAEVVLKRPVYEGDAFQVEAATRAAEDEGLAHQLLGPDGEACAIGKVFERANGIPPSMRGDAPAPPTEKRPEASRATLERLRETGLGANRVLWDGGGENGRYRDWLDDMPDLVRADRDGYAHPGFTLGLANWVLSENVYLGPWVHVESRVRHHDALELNTETITEARITDLFERGGHEFVDLDVAVYRSDGSPIWSGFHRAIYVLRKRD